MDLICIFYINIDAGSGIGKMFYLTVSAENKDGLSKPSRPFYIRSRNDNQPTYSKFTNNTVQSYFWLEVIFGDIVSFCLFFLACGEPLTVTPGSTITLTSPGYPDPVDRGVVCQWGISTTDTYLIQYRFVLIDFMEDSQTEEHSCNDAFISLSNDERPTVKIFENRTEQDIQRGSVDKFSFTSGIRSRIRKFKVLITAKGKMTYHFDAEIENCFLF